MARKERLHYFLERRFLCGSLSWIIRTLHARAEGEHDKANEAGQKKHSLPEILLPHDFRIKLNVASTTLSGEIIYHVKTLRYA